MIPYGRQSISQDDIDAVIKVLRSDYLTQGPVVPMFEARVAEYCQVEHAVAVNSATSALHVACMALGLTSDDVLWTVPNTFVASANCARYCGADVDFVDIDPVTLNMDAGALERKLVQARGTGRLPKIVIPVHFAGQSCDMKRIGELAKVFGFRVVEDASHAIGGSYDGKPVGNCEYSDITVFSFHPVKIVTAGEGGAAVARDPELVARMQDLRGHGITRDPARMDNGREGAWIYQQVSLGFNYRMTDIHAALGLSQMQRIDTFVMRRRNLAVAYDDMLAGLPITLPGRQHNAISAWHIYAIRVPAQRRQIFNFLRSAGIGVNVHYIPVHTQPYYRSLGFKRGDFPIAESYYEQAITLPLYADMTDSQQEKVVVALRDALQEVGA